MPTAFSEGLRKPLMKISRHRASSAVVLSVEGELDAFWAEELDRLIRRQERTGLRDLCVDFSSASFVDAGTVGVLVAAARRAAGNGWRLRVQNARGLVRRVFDITNLEEMIDHWQTPAALAVPSNSGRRGGMGMGWG